MGRRVSSGKTSQAGTQCQVALAFSVRVRVMESGGAVRCVNIWGICSEGCWRTRWGCELHDKGQLGHLVLVGKDDVKALGLEQILQAGAGEEGRKLS